MLLRISPKFHLDVCIIFESDKCWADTVVRMPSLACCKVLIKVFANIHDNNGLRGSLVGFFSVGVSPFTYPILSNIQTNNNISVWMSQIQIFTIFKFYCFGCLFDSNSLSRTPRYAPDPYCREESSKHFRSFNLPVFEAF